MLGYDPIDLGVERRLVHRFTSGTGRVVGPSVKSYLSALAILQSGDALPRRRFSVQA
jgi:hypothetical protein